MTHPGPVLAVRGEVTREVPPEIAKLSITVMARDRDRQATLARLSARVEEVGRLLDGYAAAIERRETSGLYVYPETKGAGERIVAYRGSVTIEVTVADFAVLGDLVLRVADQDQTAVVGPNWALRPDSPAYRQARHDAIGDALIRAREYADALGAGITRLLELADSGLSRAEPVAAYGGMQRALSLADAGPAVDLEPRLQQVYASVEARFAISDPDLSEVSAKEGSSPAS